MFFILKINKVLKRKKLGSPKYRIEHRAEGIFGWLCIAKNISISILVNIRYQKNIIDLESEKMVKQSENCLPRINCIRMIFFKRKINWIFHQILCWYPGNLRSYLPLSFSQLIRWCPRLNYWTVLSIISNRIFANVHTY